MKNTEMIVLYIKYTVSHCAIKGSAMASFLYILILRLSIEARTPLFPFPAVIPPDVSVSHDGCVRVLTM